MNEKWAKFMFFLSSLFLVGGGLFGYGLVVGAYEIWPHHQIKAMKEGIALFLETGSFSTGGHLIYVPEYASRDRILIRSPESMINGYFAIMGYDHEAGSFAVWLIDETGRERHIWPIDYQTIDSSGPSTGSDSPHGMKVLKDGSVLVNFDHGDAMARLDGCGKPIWIKDGVFHHSFDQAEDGSFWTWEGINTPHAHHQYLVNFDPDTGKTIRSLSLIDDFILKSPLNALNFSIPEGFEFLSFDHNPNPEQDIFHPNDIEELTSDLAVHFPQFSPGDLLISLRALDLLAVLDPENKTVKWANRGPWRRQHDPDFNKDGTISVYNNNTYAGRSSIISIDPATRKSEVRFANGDLRFFSRAMGKHQILPNRGALIVSPAEGRVIEVDSSGNIVFEFNNIVSEKRNAHVENATWLPRDFFESFPECN